MRLVGVSDTVNLTVTLESKHLPDLTKGRAIPITISGERFIMTLAKEVPELKPDPYTIPKERPKPTVPPKPTLEPDYHSGDDARKSYAILLQLLERNGSVSKDDLKMALIGNVSKDTPAHYACYLHYRVRAGKIDGLTIDEQKRIVRRK